MTIARQIGRRGAQPWFVFGACALAAMALEFSSSALKLALPQLSREFQAPLTTTQFIVTMSKLLFSSLMLAGGSLGDLYGHRRLLWLGSLGVGIAAALCGMASSSEGILLARGLDGVFSALVSPISLALIALAFEKSKRPMAIAMYVAVLGLADSGGTLLAGIVMQSLGWRGAFLVPGLAAALAAAIVLAVVPKEVPNQDRQKLDILGTLAWGAGLAGLVFSIIKSNQLGWTSWIIWLSFLSGTAAMLFFVWWEQRAANPVVDLSLFRNRVFSVAMAVGIVVPGITSGCSLLMLTFLQVISRSGPVTAAFQMMPWSLTVAILGPLIGYLVPRLNTRAMMSAGLALLAFGTLGMSFVKPETYYGWMVLPLVLFGAGTIATMTSRTTVVMNAVPRESSGVASAMNAATIKFGSTLGNPLVITLFLFFARGDYLDRMSPTGLSEDRIREVTTVWRRTLRENSSMDSAILPPELVEQVALSFRNAFAAGLDNTMLAVAAVSLASAAMVWFGLRELRRA
jgi:MFS family permease